MDLTILLKAALHPTTKEATRLLKELNPKIFEQWVDHVLNSEEALTQLTTNSVWHPNGFLKIIAAQGNDGERVRVHVWPSEPKAIRTEDIHDHYWNFSSKVLRGQVKIQSYAVVSGAKKFYEVRELPEFRKDRASWGAYRFRDRGVARLSQISRCQLTQGDIYSMALGELHRVKKTGEGPAATLVLQGPPIKNQTRIFLPSPSVVKRQVNLAQNAALTSELIAVLISLRS